MQRHSLSSCLSSHPPIHSTHLCHTTYGFTPPKYFTVKSYLPLRFPLHPNAPLPICQITTQNRTHAHRHTFPISIARSRPLHPLARCFSHATRPEAPGN